MNALIETPFIGGIFFSFSFRLKEVLALVCRYKIQLFQSTLKYFFPIPIRFSFERAGRVVPGSQRSGFLSCSTIISCM